MAKTHKEEGRDRESGKFTRGNHFGRLRAGKDVPPAKRAPYSQGLARKVGLFTEMMRVPVTANNVGWLVKHMRQRMNLSRPELASMIGKQPMTITNYELARTHEGIPLGTLLDIATITGCRVVVELYPDAYDLKVPRVNEYEVAYPDPFTRFIDQRRTLIEVCRYCEQKWTPNHKCGLRARATGKRRSSSSSRS